MSTHNLYFEQKYENYQNFSSESFHVGGKIPNIFEYAYFRNVYLALGLGRTSGLELIYI